MSGRSSSGLRRELVEQLRREGVLHDPRVARAFLDVPREVFVPEILAREGLAAVYRDDAIVTRRDPRSRAAISSSSQPAIMAIMLEMLDVGPGQRVLEIGAGTGYNAALLDRLVGPDGFVVSIDIEPDIVLEAAAALRAVGARVHLVVGDGAHGLPGLAVAGPCIGAAARVDRAPRVDRMMVTASTAVVPHDWHDQLADGGRLVTPLRLTDEVERAHAVTAFVKVPDGFDSVAIVAGGFMPLRRHGGAVFDPTGRSVLAAPAPTSRTHDGGDGSPLAEIDRDDVDRLVVTVRYSEDPPPTRWRFRRGGHWIGVGLRPGR